jgi:hypothetical protein
MSEIPRYRPQRCEGQSVDWVDRQYFPIDPDRFFRAVEEDGPWQTTLRTTVGATIQASVVVRNTGTDVAHDVRPRARLFGEERTGDIVRQIGPGDSHEWTFDFARPSARGRYPLLVIDLCRHRDYAEDSDVRASVA